MSEWRDDVPPLAAPTVEIQVSRLVAAAVVYLTGELDLAAADQVTMAVGDLLADRTLRQLTFDLAGVSFCDSSGIAILIKAWHNGQPAGVAVRIRAAQPQVAAVLWITGVWSVLCSEPLPEAAHPHLHAAGAEGHRLVPADIPDVEDPATPA